MRAALRLFASVQKNAQFLEAGAPTGLTGLLTHAAPRSTLLYLYSSTLEKLKQFPESSVYRQSTEALTRHRMQIIENVRPAGLEEWQQRVQKTVDEHPEAFRKIPITTHSGKTEYNIVWKATAVEGMKTDEWDDEYIANPMLEGVRSEEVQAKQQIALRRDLIEEHRAVPRIEPEPSMTAEQINYIEGEIAAGLIEEVIQVAEGERDLVDVLAKSKVWEDLEEKPKEGQWSYHDKRDTHTPETQAR
ncbi:hypothetical protein LTR85_007405 [Meristemomyces frigidus]|nr:hypothetical protein LTR85_007405 [Meristemomyces frigidus]